MCVFLALQVQYYLEIVWQLLAPSVTWVHSDEHCTCRVEGQLCSLKHESLEFCGYSILNALNLLSDH